VIIMTIDTRQFQFLREWAKKRSGILLEGKEVMVDSRLSTLATQMKFSNLGGLMAKLMAEPDSAMASKVLEALTTNETFWFRDHHPYEILKSRIVPEIIKARTGARTFRLWSAACSTGQEPYSIAMVIRQHFPQMDGWDIKILATDLSEQVVARAAKGCFDQTEINRGLPAAFLARFFEMDGPWFRVQEPIRRMIDFRTLNLTNEFALPQDLDVVFIRNVLIYFDMATKKQILLRAIKNLRAGGYLFLGSAESIYGMDLPLETVMGDKTLYYRKK
jgi:chemotaxis protein methyltransferase CheR